MKSLDLVVVLGAQIKVEEEVKPAQHTRLRLDAAGILWNQQKTKIFVLSGGYNFFVRYPLSGPVYGTPGSERQPDFSQEAFRKARIYRSEASVMAEYLRKRWNVPPERMILEEESKTTEENATFVSEIISRIKSTSIPISLIDESEVGVLTLLYHMERAFPIFQQKIKGTKVKPILAEEVLSLFPEFRKEIVEYYSQPRGGKLWEITEELLLTGNLFSYFFPHLDSF